MLITLKNIYPDPIQPRKTFDSHRLAELVSSIKKHGILNPLIIEDQKDGTYILVDGERRYRAAQELKMKEVPCTVIPKGNDIERLINQFHIQEQHESWTPTEKAMVIFRMADETKMSIQEISKVLDIADSTARTYFSFSRLINKEKFIKNKLNLQWADKVISIKTYAENIYRRKLEKSLPKPEVDKLENTIVDRIIAGDVKDHHELLKLKDIFRSDPKIIREFIDKPSPIMELYDKSGARGETLLRNAASSAAYVAGSLHTLLKSKSVKMDSGEMSQLQRCKEAITDFLKVNEK